MLLIAKGCPDSQAGIHAWKEVWSTPEQYANIKGPKTAQTIPRHPKLSTFQHLPNLQPFYVQRYPLIPDHLANSVGGLAAVQFRPSPFL